MIRLTLSGLVLAAALFVTTKTAQAQIYVPHTTTHIDLVPHRGHLDAVPHTTTHYDAVPIPSYSSNYGGYGSGYNTGFSSSYNYNSGYSSYAPLYGSQYAPQYSSQYGGYNYSAQRPVYQNSYQHRSTHLDVIPHRGHVHIVPHTTTHRLPF